VFGFSVYWGSVQVVCKYQKIGFCSDYGLVLFVKGSIWVQSLDNVRQFQMIKQTVLEKCNCL